MLQHLLALFKAHMLGVRSLFQYALLPVQATHTQSGALLDALTSTAPYGAKCMYKSLDAAVAVLLLARGMDNRLADTTEASGSFYERLTDLQHFFFLYNKNKTTSWYAFQNKQVIVLEGFDKSGKTTLQNGLTSRFNNTISCSLRDISQDMEQIFSKMPEAVSCAFDFVRCYFLARQIIEAEDGCTIFVEQFYHYSCARTACLKSGSDPRNLNETAFCWPNDLPQPNLVRIFLSFNYLG